MRSGTERGISVLVQGETDPAYGHMPNLPPCHYVRETFHICIALPC